jgi:hypothetical protein
LVRWLANRYEEAISLWQAGLNCEYTDGAGGLELPLLLYHASARHPKSHPNEEAKRLLPWQLTFSHHPAPA